MRQPCTGGVSKAEEGRFTRKYYPTAHGESLVIAGLQMTVRIILSAFAA